MSFAITFEMRRLRRPAWGSLRCTERRHLTRGSIRLLIWGSTRPAQCRRIRRSPLRFLRRSKKVRPCRVVVRVQWLDTLVSSGINAFRAMTGSLVGNVGAKHLSWATMPTETNSFEKFQKYLFHIRLLHPVMPCTMLTVSTDF